MARNEGQVHEMQGLYGPFTIAERVVQKIWLRQDFDTRGLRLLDGRPLTVVRPGHWNLMAGPDFLGARLAVAGRTIAGDVEVHFHAQDWRAHGHATDPAYRNVALHVVMFPPSDNRAVACRFDGQPLPTLVLLPLLHRSLEEYASDDALESLTARDAMERLAGLTLLPPVGRLQELRRRARARWEQKVRFAGLRLRKLGWSEAAHHTALEILGYRHNRAAMLAVAGRHPLAEWGGVAAAEDSYREAGPAWQTQGVRPANHPLRRLRQYAAWVVACPDWPEKLRGFVPVSSGITADSSGHESRKALELRRWREWVDRDLLGGTQGGSRLDNLVCDGFLPLLAAETGRDEGFAGWFHWYLGDVPGEVRRAFAPLDLAGPAVGPRCHGWGQGLLDWVIEREARASD